MAYESYAEFLDALEKAGELIRVSEPIATELEITELADREMKKPGGGKALLIEQPTVNGEVSPMPVAINTMGSARRMAMALGAESVEAVAEELGSLVQAKPPTGLRDAMALLGQALGLRHARPKKVKRGPCKEVIHRFDSPASRTEPWPSAPDVNDPSTLTPNPSIFSRESHPRPRRRSAPVRYTGLSGEGEGMCSHNRVMASCLQRSYNPKP